MTGIQNDAPVQEEELDLDIQHDHVPSEGVVLIHRDLLDDEEAEMESAWGTQHEIVVQEAQVCESVGVSVQSAEEVVIVTRDDSERQTTQDELRDDERIVEENDNPAGNVDKPIEEVDKPVDEPNIRLTEEQDSNSRNPNKPMKPSKRTKKEKARESTASINPKAHIVVVDSTISDNVKPTVTHEESQHADNDYIDLSSQMINDMNRGVFDSVLENKNVTVTYVH